MTGRLELREQHVGGLEGALRLVESALLEERPAENELRVADLVEPVITVAEQRERLTRLPLRGLDLAEPELHLRERRNCRRRLLIRARVDQDAERVGQVLDGVVRLAEQVVEAAEVVQEPSDVVLRLELDVNVLRLLRV